jgi:hypothetical protein
VCKNLTRNDLHSLTPILPRKFFSIFSYPFSLSHRTAFPSYDCLRFNKSYRLKLFLHLGRLSGQKRAEQVDGQREDDGGVLLGADGVECLQVPQLQSRRRLCKDVGGLLECA